MATTDILKLQNALVETERLGEQFLDVRAEVGAEITDLGEHPASWRSKIAI